MRTSKNIQLEEWKLTGLLLFVKGDKQYYFNSERRLVSTEIDPTRNIYLESYMASDFRRLKTIFQEREDDVVKEALAELQEGDSVSKFIMLVQKKQRLKWEPQNLRCFAKYQQTELIGEVLYERDGKAYGFNYRGELVCLGESHNKFGDDKVNVNAIMDLFDLRDKNSAAFKLAKKVLLDLNIGDNLQKFNDNVIEERKRRKEKYEEEHPLDSIDRFITKIATPSFERATGNMTKGTFDFIRVEVGIITEWHEDRLKYIKKHKDEITKRVLERIKENKRFQNFGVPINFLKVSNITLTLDSALVYVFELKTK